MKTEFQQLTELIHKNSTFVLTTHVNPDGDGIGSVLTMYRILKAYNKEVSIINISETPHYLRFLDKDNVIQQFDPQIHPEKFAACDVFMALDFNTVDRMGKMSRCFHQLRGRRSALTITRIRSRFLTCMFAPLSIAQRDTSSTTIYQKAQLFRSLMNTPSHCMPRL